MRNFNYLITFKTPLNNFYMLASQDLIALIQKKDAVAYKELFNQFYGKLSVVSLRYAKNQIQAEELLNTVFNICIQKLQQHKQPKNIQLEQFIEKEFIIEAVSFIKNIRNEYYVSSTVNANGNTSRNYNLFESSEWVDLNHVDTDLVIISLQQLVPSQRLVFNLHVIDGLSMEESVALLESSEGTVKSNLEKARYHLQKNIEKNLKSVKA